MGRITKVYYQRIAAKPGFENERVGVEAEVLAKEEPDQVLEDLIAWVDEQLGTDAFPRHNKLRAAKDYLRKHGYYVDD